jgi:site-specific recombinase XerD
VDDLAVLLPDWRVHLRARGRSAATIQSYLRVGAAFHSYLVSRGMPTGTSSITREHIEHYLADTQDRVAPATCAKYFCSLQQLFRWLTEDGEIGRSPMERMSSPQVPEQPVSILDDDLLAKLLKTCQGHTFENRRDSTIIRLLLDTGAPATSSDCAWTTSTSSST